MTIGESDILFNYNRRDKLLGVSQLNNSSILEVNLSDMQDLMQQLFMSEIILHAEDVKNKFKDL